MIKIIHACQNGLDKTRVAESIAPLALRLFLAPIFILAGYNKLANAGAVSPYFASLGFPMPEFMVYLAGTAEFVGGWFLLLGFLVRWAAIPLIFTMILAGTTAHWENGWHVLPETRITSPYEWREDLIEGAAERRTMARNLLRRHGNYEWLTETGSITVLKNGIEFAVIYLIMLLPLFFSGGGKLSLDHLITRFVPSLRRV